MNGCGIETALLIFSGAVLAVALFVDIFVGWGRKKTIGAITIYCGLAGLVITGFWSAACWLHFIAPGLA